MKSRIIIVALFVCGQVAISQNIPGTISGSFESRSHYYMDDNRLNYLVPSDRFASNNYLWLQYSMGPVSAGLQYEAYMPPLAGFPYQYEGNAITHRYLRFRKDVIDITVGSFYEQFGSGLAFRSYEERALGINTSLDGFRLILKPTKGLELKTIYGKQRRFLEENDSYLRGIDADIDIGKIANLDNSFRLGGGIVSRFERYTGPISLYPETVNAINARVGMDLKHLSFNSEYVRKSSDPDALDNYSEETGIAFSTNTTIAFGGLGVYISTRLLHEMNFQAERIQTDGYSSINYLPSNTRHYTYLLSNLYPYSTQAEGEVSAQLDLSYSLWLESADGHKTVHDLRFNYANVRGLTYNEDEIGIIPLLATTRYYGDFNLEVSSKWNRKLKTHIAGQKIYFNQGQIEGSVNDVIEAFILISDATFRINKKFSVRSEVQHLWSDDDQGNWMGLLAEISYLPGWTLYFSDMLAYEETNPTHYYNGGMSYQTSYFRINIGYGRNREGYICSGGVCRKIPAYNGFNFGITSSF